MTRLHTHLFKTKPFLLRVGYVFLSPLSLSLSRLLPLSLNVTDYDRYRTPLNLSLLLSLSCCIRRVLFLSRVFDERTITTREREKTSQNGKTIVWNGSACFVRSARSVSLLSMIFSGWNASEFLSTTMVQLSVVPPPKIGSCIAIKRSSVKTDVGFLFK